MLRAVVVLAVLAGGVPLSFGAERSESAHEVKGTGVARATEADCDRDLPRFAKRLKSLGLAVSKLECEPVDGEPEAFAPAFEATGSSAMLAETAVTIYQPTREHCEQVLRDLLAAVADSDEVVVEAACAPLTILDAEDPEKVTDTFQPTVMLLKTES